jgi:hypothetical protein
MRNFLIGVVVVVALLGVFVLWNRHQDAFHPDQNATQACQDLQAAVADPSSAGHEFDQATGLAQAAMNDNGTYAGFAGEVMVADHLVQQALSSPPLSTADASTFGQSMSTLQNDCKSDSGVDLGITKSNSPGILGSTGGTGPTGTTGNTGP